jgi:two-component sensor histidine kinase
MVGTNVDVTERKVAEEHQRLLINELNHRVKNTLAIVQGIAWQSFRGPGVQAGAREAFEGRLAALAAAHDVLTRQNWEAGSILEIVAEATAPHHAADGRLTAEGPAVDLEPKTAVALALAMHELATNAVKHGALSTPAGRVEVRWSVHGGLLRLSWRESGGPLVPPRRGRGFGVRLLEQGLAAELGGEVTLEFRPEGLVCRVEAPLGT